MSNAVTIDASVFVNAFSPTEANSDQSWRFFRELFEANTPIVVPTLMLVEVVAALARKQNNTQVALDWMEEIPQLGQITLVPLDEALAREAADVAAHHRLRGSDAVYVAVARRFGATLVTLDDEQQTRASAVVAVQRPE